jgi:hypothetical protein
MLSESFFAEDMGFSIDFVVNGSQPPETFYLDVPGKNSGLSIGFSLVAAAESAVLQDRLTRPSTYHTALQKLKYADLYEDKGPRVMVQAMLGHAFDVAGFNPRNIPGRRMDFPGVGALFSACTVFERETGLEQVVLNLSTIDSRIEQTLQAVGVQHQEDSPARPLITPMPVGIDLSHHPIPLLELSPHHVYRAAVVNLAGTEITDALTPGLLPLLAEHSRWSHTDPSDPNNLELNQLETIFAALNLAQIPPLILLSVRRFSPSR